MPVSNAAALLALATLLTAPALASPQFDLARECDPSPTVGWDNALYIDAGEGLFRQEGFLDVTAWGDDAEGDPTAGQLIADCFGEGAPHSRRVVLHHLAPLPGAPERTRPVLLVPGAGDNAIRSYTFMAIALRLAGFEVYAMTFAHRHGDNFAQAEQVANVLGHISEQHPGVKVDVIAHSKGGMPTRIYASNHPGADWSATHPAYDEHGTRYRGEIGRLMFLGSPLGGLDTSFRWTSANYFPVYGEAIDSPVSWNTFYTAGNRFLPTDLEPYSLYGGLDSNFPGQAQMLAMWDDAYLLPGNNPLLGVYAAVQQDWWTTYYGGFGFLSDADGIESAIEDSGDVMGALQATGVDPDVELYLVAGGNPILSAAGFGTVAFDLWWSDGDAAAQRVFWQEGVEAVLDLYYPWWGAFEDELPRLIAGTGILGEISGPSDGVLFIDSALDETGVTARGAVVAEARLFEALNHVELLAAGALFADFHLDEDNGFFDPDLAEKYSRPENQIIEWIVEVLSQPVDEAPVEPEPDAGVPEADAGAPDAMVGPEPDAMIGPEPDAMVVPEPDAMVDAMVDPITDADPNGRGEAGDVGPAPDAGAEPTPDEGITGGEVDGGVNADGGANDDGGTASGCNTTPGLPDSAPLPLALLTLTALRRRRRHVDSSAHAPSNHRVMDCPRTPGLRFRPHPQAGRPHDQATKMRSVHGLRQHVPLPERSGSPSSRSLRP